MMPKPETTYRPMNTDPAWSASSVVPYRLDVYATSVSDVVESVGGLLVDRSLAGWAVKIFVPAVADVRPLRILGASWDTLAPASDPRPPPTAVAVSALLAVEHIGVWQQLCAAYADGLMEFTVWGDPNPEALPAQLRPVERLMSLAARAFKSQALRALGRSPSADTEALYSSANYPTGGNLDSCAG